MENSRGAEAEKNLVRQQRYRLMWMDTTYEPGEVKVVAYDKDGNAVVERVMRTAGAPYRIVLEADRSTIKADGKDLSFVTVKVVDREGNLCPNAQHLIKYSVKGEGSYRAGANGDPTSLELFHKPQMKLFNGMMTAIVQSSDKAGEITLTATAKGLKSAKIVVKTMD
jgi:beta-galactosidase